MSKIFIGIDNGVSGSIGIIRDTRAEFLQTPTFKEQDYTKKKKSISRIDTRELFTIFSGEEDDLVFIMIERPMINSTRFHASMSAARALEATLVVIEALGLGKEFVDSKTWQNALLPKGVKGTTELKKASADIGLRMFPQFRDIIEKQGDADGILIAEYLRRQHIVQ